MEIFEITGKKTYKVSRRKYRIWVCVFGFGKYFLTIHQSMIYKRTIKCTSPKVKTLLLQIHRMGKYFQKHRCDKK